MGGNQAAGIIAAYLKCEIKEVRNRLHVAKVGSIPAVYAVGDYVYCSPVNKWQVMPLGKTVWDFVGAYHGRSVFRVHISEVAE